MLGFILINVCFVFFDSINLTVKDSSLVAVVGSVGTGKSSLLSAILGDMEKLKGSVTVRVSNNYVTCHSADC